MIIAKPADIIFLSTATHKYGIGLPFPLSRVLCRVSFDMDIHHNSCLGLTPSDSTPSSNTVALRNLASMSCCFNNETIANDKQILPSSLEGHEACHPTGRLCSALQSCHLRQGFTSAQVLQHEQPSVPERHQKCLMPSYNSCIDVLDAVANDVHLVQTIMGVPRAYWTN